MSTRLRGAPAPAGSHRSRAALTTASLCIVVVGVMIAASLAFGQNADRHRRAEVLSEQVVAGSEQMSAFKWQANTEVLEGNVRHVTSGPEFAKGEEILARLATAVRELREIQQGPATARLLDDIRVLDQVAIRAFAITRGGAFSLPATQRMMERDFQPVFGRIDRDALRAAGQQRRVAAHSRLMSVWASIGSIVLGLLTLGALILRFARLERRTTLESQRRGMERRAEERVRALLEDSTDVIAVLGEDHTIRWISSSVQELVGREAGEMLGAGATELVHPEDRPLFESVLGATLGEGAASIVEMRVQHGAGHWRHVEAVVKNRGSDQAINGIVVSIRDVTERKNFEDELRHHAFHDALTGLANRALFDDRLRHGLSSDLRTGRSHAVLFVDVDDFKTINDSLGHPAGDALLQAIAMRLDPIMRPADTIARFGGDEFAVMLEGADSEIARQTGERILCAIERPFEIDGRELTITCSVGVAVSDHAMRAEELLRNADIAMYAAKSAGKNSMREFDQAMHATAVQRLELSAELPRALSAGEMFLQYQPIVAMPSGEINGVESLIRWNHPTRGLLPPLEFIPLAEETGQIVEVGRWVLEQACMQAKTWHTTHPDRTPIYVTVNVSVRQLREPTFPSMVAEILERTGLSPQCLVLEITESLLASEPANIQTRLRELKRLGLRVAVDDFGTGYSALSHLQEFPLDILKIDKSFIDQLVGAEPNTNIVMTILKLAANMDLRVVAEGIEEPEQSERLLSMRCDQGQGYLFSRPVPAERIDALLSEPVASLPGV